VLKQLLPIYDKPMIYYPLSVLILAGIRDILILTTDRDKQSFENLLGNGSNFGINLTYKIQDSPKGIPEAFIIGEDFIGKENVCLILGDNIFHGRGLNKLLKRACDRPLGATIFGYQVKDPSRFGVVELDQENKIKSIVEKPELPKSNIAVTGLYFYDNKVIDYAKTLKPSIRGELEISDLNNMYIKNGELYLEYFGRGFAWIDAGTHKSMLEASMYIENVQSRQGVQIACLEEIAINNNWLSAEDISDISLYAGVNDYYSYLKDVYG
jgi:glucose-1-phosphate thymidylyltransferase